MSDTYKKSHQSTTKKRFHLVLILLCYFELQLLDHHQSVREFSQLNWVYSYLDCDLGFVPQSRYFPVHVFFHNPIEIIFVLFLQQAVNTKHRF